MLKPGASSQGVAGTSCMLCHLYHDTSKDPLLHGARRKEISIDAIFGKEAPGALRRSPN